ncbi:hypothetical protein Droror1_Dr00006150 [Drosera rotundifolia]
MDVFLGVTAISFAAFTLSQSLPFAVVQALACGAAGAFTVHQVIKKHVGHLLLKSLASSIEEKEDHAQHKSIGFFSDVEGPKGTQLEIVYGVFGYMQVGS